MQATYEFALAALVCNLLLGLAVYAVNPRRPTNRSFLLLTGIICTWLGLMAAALLARAPERIAWLIRILSAVGSFWPATFGLLRLSILHYRERWRDHFRRAWVWFLAAGSTAAFCFSPYFLTGVRMIGPRADMPAPVYGWHGLAAMIFFGYLSVTFLLNAVQLIRDQFNRRLIGVQRVELQFLLLGYSAVILSFFLNRALMEITKSEQLNHYAPLRVVAFNIIIAYGITSRGILNVRSALRLGLSYLLLAVYAGGVFAAVWYCLARGVRTRSPSTPSSPRRFARG